MNVTQIPSDEAYQWIMQKHYAHRMPCVQYAFGLFENGFCSGIVSYGQPASPSLCIGLCGPELADKVLELNRLCVDSKSKNASSFLVSHSLRLLPNPRIIVSFADMAMGHVGYIYQASNFLYTGLSAERADFIDPELKNKHCRHNRGRSTDDGLEKIQRSRKHRYVMFLGNKKEVREMRKLLRYAVLSEYPKGDTQRYDASAEIPTQAVFF